MQHGTCFHSQPLQRSQSRDSFGKSSHAPPRSFITSGGRKSSGNLVPPSRGFSRGCVCLPTLTAQTRGTNCVHALKRHSANSVKINIFKATRRAKSSSCCLHCLHEAPGKASAPLSTAGLAASEGRSAGSFCRDGDVQTFVSSACKRHPRQPQSCVNGCVRKKGAVKA